MFFSVKRGIYLHVAVALSVTELLHSQCLRLLLRAQVLSNTVDMVYQSVASAKDAVMGAVMGGIGLTQAAVSSGISTVMGTRMGQMVSSGMDMALSRTEDWVNQKLPVTESELGTYCMSKPCQPRIANFIFKLFHLNCPCDLPIFNPVHSVHSQ